MAVPVELTGAAADCVPVVRMAAAALAEMAERQQRAMAIDLAAAVAASSQTAVAAKTGKVEPVMELAALAMAVTGIKVFAF